MYRALLQSRIVRSIASVRLGVVTGLVGAALLALSSAMVPSPRGPTPLPFSESFEPFFDPIHARYWWFYGLFALFSLYALSITVSALRSALLRRRDQWNARFVGILLMHLAVVGGLGSHLIAGFSAQVEEGGLITSTPSQIAGRRIELIEADAQQNPDGSLRTAWATVRIDGGEPARLGYNEPLFFDGYTRFVLFQSLEQVPGAARFQVGSDLITANPGQGFEFGGRHFRVEEVSTHPSLRSPLVRVTEFGHREPEEQWIAPGWRLGPGIRLVGFDAAPAIAVLVRRNDALPLLFGTSLLFCIGLVLFLYSERASGRSRASSTG